MFYPHVHNYKGVGLSAFTQLLWDWALLTIHMYTILKGKGYPQST